MTLAMTYLNETQAKVKRKMSESEEIWKPVVGYEGLYEVSDKGRVRGCERTIKVNRCGRSEIRKLPMKLLRPASHSSNGHIVSLAKNGKSRTQKVHRLVMAAFIGPCPNSLVVCHKDGNPFNNYLYNLRYDTQKANMDDCRRHGNLHIGSRNGKARLNEEKVLIIADLIRQGVSQVRITRIVGENARIVSRIATGQRWSHLTGIVRQKNV